MSNRLAHYQNSVWLADDVGMQRYISRAIARPCPSAKEIRERHRENMSTARTIADLAIDSIGADDPIEAKAEASKTIRAVKGRVGVIPIYGVTDQRLTPELEKAGGTPLDFVAAAFESLLANEKIGAIVLHFDSPGGSVHGVQELADQIYSARSVKPIYAMADTMMCSAAFWLGTSASMVISTPAGGADAIGSVGVRVMHVDQSKADEAEGFKFTYVHAGKHKVEFNPHAPLAPESLAEAQARVDDIYDVFVGTLKRNRGTSAEDVRRNYGEGRTVTPTQALKAGMIDRVMPMHELLAKLTGSGSSSAGAHHAAQQTAELQAKLRLARGLRERQS